LNKQENHTICNARADIATFTGRTIVLKDGHIIQDYINTNVQSAAKHFGFASRRRLMRTQNLLKISWKAIVLNKMRTFLQCWDYHW
jgi:hypothetical protein